MLSRLRRATVRLLLDFLLETLPRFLATGGKSPTNRNGVFRSFDEALETCQPGYDSQIIAEVVARKTEAFAKLLSGGQAVLDVYGLRPLAAVGFAGPKKVLRVVDFGGGAGVHYFTARELAPSAQLFDWRVVETESMCRASQALANSELSFFTDLDSVQAGWEEPPDLAISVGAIMCVPDPLRALENLLRINAPRVYIGGTGLSPDGETRIMVQFSRLSQNGPGALPPGYDDAVTAYPNTFVPRNQFESRIEACGYRIRVKKNETRNAWQAGSLSINQYGYLLEKVH